MERIVCLLILASLKIFAQDEFIFWAELSSKNLILFHQSQNISPAMTQSENAISEFVCEIPYNDNDLKKFPKTELGMIDDYMAKNIKLNFLNSHKEELIDCFASANISIKDITKIELMKAQNETYVKILPLRFCVEFGERSALIYHLKKK
ncbi:hypothetical protein [Campylobacter estrildidarum]|uniref:Flagellar-associated protein FlgQ n=1 Tax=Campylobacter estrildidarum TaxID=2510189 RepID=A0A4V6DX51_9BACT|nr:hypothetical protein [Campylobacter estrildidarum]TKX29892.1 hypothetical protein CQA69_06895 [Campylobacter estrildidarum]